MAVRIDPGLCPQNHRCPMIDVCPVEAISQEGFALPTVDPERCISCGQCVAGCGKGAMSLPTTMRRRGADPQVPQEPSCTVHRLSRNITE